MGNSFISYVSRRMPQSTRPGASLLRKRRGDDGNSHGEKLLMVTVLITIFIIKRISLVIEVGDGHREGRFISLSLMRYLSVNDSIEGNWIMDCRWVENYFSNNRSHYWNRKHLTPAASLNCHLWSSVFAFHCSQH